jgi:hypothetical protein
MELLVRRLRDTARWRDKDGKPRNSDRTPMNVHPLTLYRLNRQFLTYGPGAKTGIGYTEFLELSMDLWEQIEAEAIMQEHLEGANAVISVPRDEIAPHYFHGDDRYGACDVCGLSRPAHHCDDCGRSDGTHDMEVEH